MRGPDARPAAPPGWAQSAPAQPMTVLPVPGMPEVRTSDDLPALLLQALTGDPCDGLREGDVLVVSAKLVSKALGLRAPAAHRQAHVLAQSRRVVAERSTPEGLTRVVEAVAGPVLVAAGIDASNTGPDEGEPTVLLLPPDPDERAAELHTSLCALTGVRRLGVVLSDTAGRPWRAGQVDFALGAAGLVALEDLRGGVDADGRPLRVTATAVADELAAAADMVRPKQGVVGAAVLRGVPAHLVRETTEGCGGGSDPRGVEAAGSGGARDLVRTGESDWFALGHIEAVRQALGVCPGTAEAVDIGIRDVALEDVGTRLERACRLALYGPSVCEIPPGHPRHPAMTRPVDLTDIGFDLVQQGVNLAGTDPLALGVAAGRLLVALESEGLHGRIARHAPATRPGTPERVHIVLL